MRVSQIVAAAGCVAMLFAATAVRADPIGEWRVADGTATVRIRHCGKALCGFIAATVGAPGRDTKNPDPRKRGRSVLGMEILIDMRAAGPGRWVGTTYNSEDGQMYAATLTMPSPAALRIQGCLPGGGMCGSETWSRVK